MALTGPDLSLSDGDLYLPPHHTQPQSTTSVQVGTGPPKPEFLEHGGTELKSPEELFLFFFLF